ncbi:AAA family ATPase [Rhizobium sp. BR 362]|uniref:AAA family ATPase n=1 Tax=Rhizobium sp. BR 362 TaxID=3040670 RepID=UPI002F4164AD
MQEMLRTFKGVGSGPINAEPEGEKFIDLDHMVQLFRRQVRIVLLFAGIGLLIGVTNLAFATYYFTAGTSILLDENLNRFGSEISPAPANMEADKKIMSQVAILKSSALAAKVVDNLHLYDNYAFFDPSPSMWARVKSLLKGAMDLLAGKSTQKGDFSNEDVRRGAAVAVLLDNLRVEQEPQSFVVDLFYTSTDRVLAAAIANAYAEAYLSDKFDANFDASQRATVWLRARLADLKEQSQEASLRVERFRTANNLTATKGALLSEEQLSDMSAQLIVARAQSAKALALYNQYKSIVDAGQQSAVDNAATVSNQDSPSLVTTLRERYQTIEKRAQEIEDKFGSTHPQAISLRSEQNEVGRQIYAELKQMTESYRNQYEVAQSWEASLKEGLLQVTGKTSEDNKLLVELKNLERNAEAISDLYKTYLARYQETAQNQSFPITEARVISAATPPTDASSPKRTWMLAGFLLLGAFFGIVVGGWREFREVTLRIGEDVSRTLGVKFLGYLPRILPADEPDGSTEQPQVIDIMRFATMAPGSQFSETLRHAKIVADTMLGFQQCKVIGIASVLPGEGKSTVAANLAALLASTRARTLLIDADLRKGSLTKLLNIPIKKSLSDVLSVQPPQYSRWRDTIIVDNQTKLEILPTEGRFQYPNTSDLISGVAMARLLDDARTTFKYVIVDLPPLAPVFDTKAFERLADGFVMVAEWGVTPRSVVKTILEAEPQIAAKTLGMILNKAELEKLYSYSAYGSSEHLIARYSSYYREHHEMEQDKLEEDKKTTFGTDR